ncbi:hypothetical protein U14_04932 [Candidatus Moduliflexus flocculans]|uniref:PLD phosphodiesterase domain-containing protein n=1 Tax=Candidatus Moduliflexus flocculans TaxID=1499966 RepID=A0A0S6W5X1_9BACT|nr:hypothetical protein U14_04932 [Candidatus Moduliflexus flocculans]
MMLIAALCCFVLLIILGCYHAIFKKNPSGLSYTSAVYQVDAEDVCFLYDLTYQNAAGDIVAEQQIFDAVFERIAAARRYILLDMFLFNSTGHLPEKNVRDLAGQLTARLVERRRQQPEIAIDVITDPINSVYGGARSPEIEALRQAGVNVIYTNLMPLRDSNLLYSPVWRLLFQWFGNSPYYGMFPHPFSPNDASVTLRSYLMMFNFKANHRKVFIADNGEHMTTILTSANPHNGSSAHSNVALRIDGAFSQAVYAAESAVAVFSGGTLHRPPAFDGHQPEDADKAVTVQLLTEHAIKRDLLALFEGAAQDDRLLIGMFYLTDRQVMASLFRAARRGVDIRIILDPSNDAFGRQKYGIPNQPAARELVVKSNEKIRIRWYATHGEQYHAKFILLEMQRGIAHLLVGSANLTRRHLENYNLEMNAHVTTARADSPVIREARRYFERLWMNEGGNLYTLDYMQHQNTSRLKTALYKFAEFSGISTF